MGDYSEDEKDYHHIKVNDLINEINDGEIEDINILDDYQYIEMKKSLDTVYDNFIENNTCTDKDNDKECIYPILDVLNNNETELNDFLNNNIGNIKINLCAFQVTDGLFPFLQYFLLKNNPNDIVDNTENSTEILKFISFNYEKGHDVQIMCECILKIIFTCYKSLFDLYIYKGFIIDEDTLNCYFFYDCTQYNIGVHTLYKNNDIWLVLMDEIVNQKMVCNFNIDDSVINFFIKNNKATYLINNSINPDIYEMPIVGYCDCEKKKTDFMSIFGVGKTREYNLKTKYYYFTDYTNALNALNVLNVLNATNVIDNIGINRFALFLGSMKVHVLNDSNEDDECTHDSLFILNNMHIPRWALTTYEQQTPLTSHYKDKKSKDNCIL